MLLLTFGKCINYFLALIEFRHSIDPFSRNKETADGMADKCLFTPGRPLESLQFSVFAQQLSKLNVKSPIAAIHKTFYLPEQ